MTVISSVGVVEKKCFVADTCRNRSNCVQQLDLTERNILTEMMMIIRRQKKPKIAEERSTKDVKRKHTDLSKMKTHGKCFDNKSAAQNQKKSFQKVLNFKSSKFKVQQFIQYSNQNKSVFDRTGCTFREKVLVKVLDGMLKLINDTLTERRLLVNQLHQSSVVLDKIVVLLLKVLQLAVTFALQLCNILLRMSPCRVKVRL